MSKRKKSSQSSSLPEDFKDKIREGLYSGKPITGEGGVFTNLLQEIIDTCLDVEMDVHLSEEKAKDLSNRRNGKGKKTIKSQFGEVEINPPRDRNSSFAPEIVEKRSRKLGGGFDNTILALYAQGNSNEDVSRLIKEMYGVNYSASAVSNVTEMIWPKLLEWQQRPLEPCYAILYLDGMCFRIKEDGKFTEKVVYSLYGVNAWGKRDVLGLYIDGPESKSNWSLVLDDLQNRGVEKIFFTCIDGLPGFKNIIQDYFPTAIVQRCIVHKIRNSVRFAPDKDKRKLCSGLRKVYGAINREQAEIALNVFEKEWGKRGKKIADSWRSDWDELMAFMEYGPEIRRMIYTTNPVEALHRIIRKLVKAKGAWVSEKALTKQLYMSLMQNEKSWKRKAHKWNPIIEELSEKFGNEFTMYLEK